MKNTLTTIALFIILTLLFSQNTLAILPPENVYRDTNIQIKLPTATPTPIIFKKIDPNINVKLIPTLASKLTVTPTPTLGTKLTVTPEPTLETKLTVTPEQSPAEISPSVEASKTDEKLDNKSDLNKWFTWITVGLLGLIMVIQFWPKQKEDQ